MPSLQQVNKSYSFTRLLYSLSLLLLFLIPVSFFCSNDPQWLLTALLVLLGLSLGVFLLWKGSAWGAVSPIGIPLLGILLFCFGIKLFWISYAQIEPAQDYATFYQYAQHLAKQDVIWGGRYMALFPHLFGYAFFLGTIGKWVGFSSFLAPFINVLLSTASCGLLFFLGCRLFNRRTAMIAGVLWALFPSQTIYNMYVLSEPLYTTGILLFFTIITGFFSSPDLLQRRVYGKSIFFGIISGILLTTIQMTRPVGTILLIGLCLYSLLFYFRSPRNWKLRGNLLLFFAVLLFTYVFSHQLGTAYLESRIGEPASKTAGYSILVGLNEASDGRWNQEDSDLLASFSQDPTVTAEQVQKQMLEQAKDRIRTIDDFPELLWNKFTIFLSHDHACVNYGKPILIHTDFLSLACNSFYLFCCFLALFGVFSVWQQADCSPLLFLMLYFIGLIFAQLLVEVSGRYHYSLLPILVLFGAQGTCSLASFFTPYRGKRLEIKRSAS